MMYIYSIHPKIVSISIGKTQNDDQISIFGVHTRMMAASECEKSAVGIALLFFGDDSTTIWHRNNLDKL